MCTNIHIKLCVFTFCFHVSVNACMTLCVIVYDVIITSFYTGLDSLCAPFLALNFNNEGRMHVIPTPGCVAALCTCK